MGCSSCGGHSYRRSKQNRPPAPKKAVEKLSVAEVKELVRQKRYYRITKRRKEAPSTPSQGDK